VGRLGAPRCGRRSLQHAGGGAADGKRTREEIAVFSQPAAAAAPGDRKLTDRRTTELLSYCGIAAESFGYKLHIEFHTGS
jgi:hypothetical protein